MRVDEGLGHRREGDAPVVLTIGNFDGVHLGHLALLAEVRERAIALGAQTALLTFDPHPRCVLDPARCPRSLTTLTEKTHVLASWGLGRLVVLPFTHEVSGWSAGHVCDLLREALDVRALVVGYDFALGHKRQGDVTFLRDYWGRHGVEVVQVGEVQVAGGTASSGRVRELLAAGDVGGAATLLGRQYFMDALVVHGDEVGRHLGYPTANLSIAAEKCIPDPGVYAMWVRVEGTWRMAATNVGYRPTFGGNRLTVEAFLLDFEGDIYDQPVRAVFVRRLREERAYATVDELVAQIGLDVASTREILAADAPPPA